MTGPVVEYETAVPAPRLRAYVDRYVGYRLAGFPPGVHWGLPSRHLTFIVSLAAPIDVVAQVDPRQAPDRYGVVVGGLQDGAARIAHDGNQEGVAIDVTPLGSRAVLGVPAVELWNTSLELDDAVAGVGRELRERLLTARGWPARFAVCDEVLCHLLDRHARGPVAPELARAWSLFDGSGGAITVSQVAADVGWTRQHLARRFAAEFGAGPKLAARLMRFERAHRLLRASPPARTIAEVAALCGYYDQAHLDREFRELAGGPPSQLLEEDVPSVQDDDGTGPPRSDP